MINPISWLIEKIEEACFIAALLYITMQYYRATEALFFEIEKCEKEYEDAKEVSE